MREDEGFQKLLQYSIKIIEIEKFFKKFLY